MGTTLKRTGEQQPATGKGKGTDALGPSDTSDTGSDITGGPGLNEEIRAGTGLGLDRGTTSDPDVSEGPAPTAGPDVGDANLDSDAPASGSGERATVGRDVEPTDTDRDTDRIVRVREGDIEHPENAEPSASDLAAGASDEEIADAGASPSERNRPTRKQGKR